MAVPAPYYRILTTDTVIYLTFDDGPYVDFDVTGGRVTATTTALLDKLDALRNQYDSSLSATFFLNGWALERRAPESAIDPTDAVVIARQNAAKAIIDRGHNIANHAYFHNNPAGEHSAVLGPQERATVDQIVPNLVDGRRALFTIGTKQHKLAILNQFRSPGDPSYYFPEKLPGRTADKTSERTPAERAYQNAKKAAYEARRRLEKVLQSAAIANTPYVTFSIFTKDNELHTAQNATVEQMAKRVYWHFVDVRQLKGRQAEFAGSKFRSTLQDPDRLSFELLSDSDRRGAIALMHNGRAASITALDAFSSTPAVYKGIVPFVYTRGYSIRKLPVL